MPCFKSIEHAVITSAVLAMAIGGAHAQWSNSCPQYTTQPYTGYAADAAGLNTTVQDFIMALGGANNGGNPGPLPSGFRSINWDADAVPFNMPPDQFLARGAFFTTISQTFLVSNPPANSGVADDEFSSVLPAEAASQFVPFSGARLFTPLFDNSLAVLFYVPGSEGAPAGVSGFGAVFSDVDAPEATKLTYYNKDNCIIGVVVVPAADRGLSFGGLRVTDGSSPIMWVKIELGTHSLLDARSGAYGPPARKLLQYSGASDIVVMDDFIYGEPQAMA